MASIPTELMGRITSNGARGKSARHYLRRNMAQLSPEEIAKLPASTLKRISRELRRVAMTHADGIDAVPAQATALAPSPLNGARPKPSLIMMLVEIVVVTIALTMIAVVAERPVRWGLFHVGLFSSEQMGLCQRLDRWTDDCGFAVQAEGIGIEYIAALVELPLPVLAAANPTFSLYEPLPKGAFVRIDRSGDTK